MNQIENAIEMLRTLSGINIHFTEVLEYEPDFRQVCFVYSANDEIYFYNEDGHYIKTDVYSLPLKDFINVVKQIEPIL